MSAAKERETKKLKLREKKQREALAAAMQALKSIENECKQSIKHYKEQGWKENRTVVDIREIAAGALRCVEKLKAEFLEESPGRPAMRLSEIDESSEPNNVEHDGEVPKGHDRCPECGEVAGIPIMYGHSQDPEEVEEFIEEVGFSQVWLGGNYWDANLPGWHCTKCGHEWGQRIQEIPERP